MSGRCIDYPCCGHTDGLPCDWTPPDYSKDPHAYCDHENGDCEVGDYFDDGLDEEDEGEFVARALAGDVPEDTPLALDA